MPREQVNDDRLYRALDRLLPHKAAIEQHLQERLGELFALDYDLLLYDVTSTYFEGQAEGNPLAQRGHSRDHRPDCKQVCIALVVTREGMPLGYEVFAGNRIDVTTVEEIVETMEARYGLAQRIWVMDRGMASAQEPRVAAQTGRRYLVGTRQAASSKRWRAQLADARDWQAVREGVEAKLCPGRTARRPSCCAARRERREKEQAMHERFARRIEAGPRAASTGGSRRPARRSTAARIERQIGRLLERNSRAAGRYRVELVDDPTLPAGVRLEWRPRRVGRLAAHSEGCYVLRTNAGRP